MADNDNINRSGDREPENYRAELERKTQRNRDLETALQQKEQTISQMQGFFSALGRGRQNPALVRDLLKETFQDQDSGEYPEWIDRLTDAEVARAGKQVQQQMQGEPAPVAAKPDPLLQKVQMSVERLEKRFQQEEQQRLAEAKRQGNQQFLNEHLYEPAKKMGLDDDTVRDLEGSFWWEIQNDQSKASQAADLLKSKLQRYDPKKTRTAARQEQLQRMDETLDSAVSPSSDSMPSPDVTTEDIYKDARTPEEVQDIWHSKRRNQLLQQYASEGADLKAKIT
jgi:hypothetical protein